MKAVYKVYRAETKIKDAAAGLIHAIVSTDAVDRDNEIIHVDAWKKHLPSFMKHPILLSSHDYRSLRNQIGEVVNLEATKRGMEADLRYYIGEGNEEADWGFKLAERGKAAFSVGFIPFEFEDGDGEKGPRRTYTDVELLEISHVTVPSNREALQALSVKGLTGAMAELVEELLEDGLDDDEIEEILDEEKSAIIGAKPFANEHACRLRDPGDFQSDSFRRIDRESEGKRYSVIMGRLKGETSMTEQSYRYPKDSWSESEARSHCKGHDGQSFEVATGEERIMKTIDWTSVISELEAGKAPRSIYIKIGATLSAKNRGDLEKAVGLINGVLESARPAQDEESSEEKPKLMEVDLSALQREVFAEIMGRK